MRGAGYFPASPLFYQMFCKHRKQNQILFEINQQTAYMKALSNLIPVIAGLLLGCTVIYLTLYQYMTYDKYTINVAGRDYVREVTRWAGHKHVVNIPVMHPEDIQSSKLSLKLYSLQPIKGLNRSLRRAILLLRTLSLNFINKIKNSI